MKDILNRRSALRWFNLLETFLSHKNPERFCSNFPGYIQNPVWNNPLNQAGPHCPANWGLLGQAAGANHREVCYGFVIFSPLSRFTEAPALSCHLETHSHPLTTAKIPVLSQATPPAGWQRELLTLNRQKQTCSVTRVALRGCTVEENPTLKMFQNQRPFALQFFAFGRQNESWKNNLRTEN